MYPETGLQQPMSLREKVAFYLAVETPAGRVVNLIITGLVLLSSVIFVIETYRIPPELLLTLKAINTLIIICFAVEYLLRLWCAEQKVKYLLSIYSLIDLVVILPFFLGVIDVSFILIFRWLRILHLMRFITSKTWLGIINQEDGVILARILFTLFAIIFIYSGLIYQVEHAVNSEAFRTFFDAVYFSIVTMTTVGFGDITPVSEGGRWMTLFMIVTGIALIPWQVGDLIKHLVKTANHIEMPCPGCGLYFHDADAKFCKHCGTKLEQIENSR
ncbi:MAG: ion transporter [Hormoscilla sp.]